jgi:prophage regulatory protein
MTGRMRLEEAAFLRVSDVLRLIPISKSTWWSGVRQGRYPTPVKLGPGITAWRADEIRNFIEAQSHVVQG